jgi:hypothetical protein
LHVTSMIARGRGWDKCGFWFRARADSLLGGVGHGHIHSISKSLRLRAGTTRRWLCCTSHSCTRFLPSTRAITRRAAHSRRTFGRFRYTNAGTSLAKLAAENALDVL